MIFIIKRIKSDESALLKCPKDDNKDKRKKSLIHTLIKNKFSQYGKEHIQRIH